MGSASSSRVPVLRSVAQGLSRRGALGGALGSALVAAGLGGPPASAKKKKKGCLFTKTATTWTLQKSCTAASTITIDQNVTVDGGGKTITLKRTSESFISGLYVAGLTVTIRNLTIDGSGVRYNGACSGNLNAIRFFNASGRVENVSIRNLLPKGECPNIIGVHVAAGSTPPVIDVDVVGCTIEDVGAYGVQFDLNTGGSVSGSTIRRCPTGIYLHNTRDTTVENTTLVGPVTPPVWPQNFIRGILADSRGGATSLTGNAVSDFRDASAYVACGIDVVTNSSGVTLGTNTFPPSGDPHANEQDIC